MNVHTQDTIILNKAASALVSGGIIAYPTEAVYGLGCLPKFESSIRRLLNLKQRSKEKGLIVVAETIEQLYPYIDTSGDMRFDEVKNTWPGPVTWLLPVKEAVSDWITGGSEFIAVRVSDHPIVKKLCHQVGPLISTSANPAMKEPAKTSEQVHDYFQNHLDFIYSGPLGDRQQPTEIRHGITGEVIRPGG